MKIALICCIAFLLVACSDTTKPEPVAPPDTTKPEPVAPPDTTKPSTVKLTILATTDLHCHIADYDYYRDNPSVEMGLARTASLIKKEREQNINTLLFDNGDLIQGNPMSDVIARIQGLPQGTIHPVYKAMNLLKYDSAGLGNHEFNYGLDFLQQALSGAQFPYVCSNLYIADNDDNVENDKPYLQPYIVLQRTFKDEQGHAQNLNIGVLSVVPRHITKWDAGHLAGKVIVQPLDTAVKKWLPIVKSKGADIVVLLAHAGLGNDPDEWAVSLLADIKGIDAIIAGHSHDAFPLTPETKVPGIVSPQAWGGYLGVIKLTLEKQSTGWCVVQSESVVKPICERQQGKVISLAEPDQEVISAIQKEHLATLNYIRQEIGQTTVPLNTYFALIHDNAALEVINRAQSWYISEKLKDTPYANLPVLSAAAPFKCGGRGGPMNYTDIPQGTLTLKSMANLYVYPNTIKALLLNGHEVREWLEMSACQFNHIQIDIWEPQNIINEKYQAFNFDVIDGVSFEIDVTQPARYDFATGKLVNPSNWRIFNLCYQNKPVTKQQKFIVVTNNYRAHGGGNFPGLTGQNIIYNSPDEVRQIIVAYIQQQKIISPQPDNNWRFCSWPTQLKITFPTAPQADLYAKEFSNVKKLQVLDNGFVMYSLEPLK